MYGQAVKAAQSAGDPLLIAYQIGSLAQFEGQAGNAAQALNLAERARKALGTSGPQIADAWLASVEALAHAAGGDPRKADRSLVHSRTVAAGLSSEEPPPWPWVFVFNEEKVAAARVTCGTQLGLSDWVLGEDVAALTTGHATQRALLILDVARGHMAAGHVEAGFAPASSALDVGLEYRSGRIVERARAFRRSFTSSSLHKDCARL